MIKFVTIFFARRINQRGGYFLKILSVRTSCCSISINYAAGRSIPGYRSAILRDPFQFLEVSSYPQTPTVYIPWDLVSLLRSLPVTRLSLKSRYRVPSLADVEVFASSQALRRSSSKLPH